VKPSKNLVPSADFELGGCNTTSRRASLRRTGASSRWTHAELSSCMRAVPVSGCDASNGAPSHLGFLLGYKNGSTTELLGRFGGTDDSTYAGAMNDGDAVVGLIFKEIDERARCLTSPLSWME
jgi:hypothetical protein